MKMEPIALNRKFLKMCGMCLDADTASLKDRRISKYINWTLLWISLCTIGVSLEYIISHFDDTESILFAVMQVSANTASGGGYWAFYGNKFKVSTFLSHIQNLIESRKSK